MDPRRVLIVALLVLSIANAQVCYEKNTSKKEWDSLVDVLYGGKVPRIPTDITSVGKVQSGESEVNEITLIDPKNRTAVSVETPRKMYDSNADVPFSERVSVGGVTYVVGVVDDTVRVAKGLENPYANEPGIYERFEGGVESGISAGRGEEGTSIIEAAKTETELFMEAFSRIAGSRKNKIDNIITSDDFEVLVSCESSGCSQILYSLLTKYMNIGTSAQMGLEFLGGSVLHRVLPSFVRREVTLMRDKIRVSDFVEKITKGKLNFGRIKMGSWLDVFSNTVARMSDEGKDVVTTTLTKSFTDAKTIFKQLNLQEKRKVFRVSNILKWDIEKIKLKASRGEDVTEDLKSFFEKLEKIGIYEIGGEEIENLKSKNYEELKQILGELHTRLDEATKKMAADVPFSYGLYERIRENTMRAGFKGESVFSDFIAAPLAYYFVKKGVSSEMPVPTGGGPVFSLSNAFPRPIRGPYAIPSEWKVILLKPAEGAAYHAFVDIFANKRSDPGDFFKTILSYWGPGLIMKVIEKASGGSHPIIEQFIVTEKMQRLYHTGNILFAISQAQKVCPSCISTYASGKLVINWMGSPGSIYATENKRENTSNIIFGHHTDIDFGDVKISLEEAERKGEACRKKCPLANFGDVRYTGFAMSLVQSAMYVFNPIFAVPVDAFLGVMVYGPCQSCVDTTGGYYIHTLAFTPKRSSPSKSLPEEVQNITKKVMPKEGPFKQAVEKTKDYLKTEETEKTRSTVQVALNVKTGSIGFTKKIAEGTNAGKVLPAEYTEKGGAVLVTKDGNFVIDPKTGKITYKGITIIDNEDGVRMYSYIKSIPAIVIPSKLMYSSFSNDPSFKAENRRNYEFLDIDYINCFERTYGNDPRDMLGPIDFMKTTDGETVFDSHGGYTTSKNYTGEIKNMHIDGDYNVSVLGKKEKVEKTGVYGSYEDIGIGKLKGIVFDNGVIVRKENTLITWVVYLYKIPKEAVDGVMFSVDKNNNINIQLVPDPNAPEDVYRKIEKLNEELNRIGPINVIDAEGATVAFVRDKNGDLWMTYLDKEKNQFVKEKVRKIYPDPEDPSTLLVETDKGTHRIKVYTAEDGTPYLIYDGENKGIIRAFGGRGGTLLFDPDKGEWSLLSGNIIPLDKRFSSGISTEVGEDGKTHTKPFQGVYVVNTPSQAGGLVLPLFGGWEKIIAIVLLILIIAYIT